jgi:hypothetical protein
MNRIKGIYSVLLSAVVLSTLFFLAGCPDYGTPITTLDELKSAFKNGGTYIIDKNITVPAGTNLTVKSGNIVCLKSSDDYSGAHSITFKLIDDQSVGIKVNSGGYLKLGLGSAVLTIKPSVSTWYHQHSLIENEGTVYLFDNSKLESTSGDFLTLLSNRKNGIVEMSSNAEAYNKSFTCVENEGTFTMDDGYIHGNAGEPAAAFSNSGNFTMNGGKIEEYGYGGLELEEFHHDRRNNLWRTDRYC